MHANDMPDDEFFGHADDLEAELDDLRRDRIAASRLRVVAAPVGGRAPATPAEIIASWRTEGPIVHEPTEITSLDEVTGGGLVYGSRVYLIGAPDAGKTAFCVQLADNFVRRGVDVGILAVDEDPSDIVTRLAQRSGWKRRRLENRSPRDLDQLGEELSSLAVRIYDASWTIDAAADELASEAARTGRRAVLFIDSMQTAMCSTENGTMSVREAISLRVQTVRDRATRHKMLIVATSEMGRHAYRPLAAEQNDMAAAKESGAIEYSARVLLALRTVVGEPDLAQLRVVKNKHGPSGAEIYLRLDRSRMTLTEVEPPTSPDTSAADVAQRHQRTAVDAARVAVVIAAKPGLGRREIAAAVRAEHGSMSTDRLETALAALADAVVRVAGPRGAQRLYLCGAKVAEPVLGSLDANHRAMVACSSAPSPAAEVDGAA